MPYDAFTSTFNNLQVFWLAFSRTPMVLGLMRLIPSLRRAWYACRAVLGQVSAMAMPSKRGSHGQQGAA